MADAPELSLVIPCYNEQDNLRPLAAAIRAAGAATGAGARRSSRTAATSGTATA